MPSRAARVPKLPPPKDRKMPVRLRKLIGTVLLIILVVVYALAAVTFASLLLGASPWWVHLLYFFFTGLLWVLPAMLIIKWMEKPAADH
jgi:RsiW-degrading membrane proteinase PrsW (M82 family)